MKKKISGFYVNKENRREKPAVQKNENNKWNGVVRKISSKCTYRLWAMEYLQWQ